MGARDYDPRLGRWLSADTIVPNPANSQSFNRYAYVYNNPLKYTDPSGRRACSDWDANGQCLVLENPNPALLSPLVRFVGDWDLVHSYAVVQGAETVAAEMYATVQADRQRAMRIAEMTGRDPSEYSSMSHLWDLSEDELFLAVYGGPVVFVVKPQCSTGDGDCVDSDAWAWSRVGELGEVWVNEEALKKGSGYGGFAAQQNTVHELMHGLDQRGGGVASDNLGAAMTTQPFLTASSGGFATGPGWEQRRAGEDTPSEMFADMGLGWTYGRWAYSKAKDYQAGLAKARYMKEKMPGLIALAVANN